jgi:hypothetical protein
MDRVVVFSICFLCFALPLSAQSHLDGSTSSSWWSTYGYIIIGAGILIAAIWILIRKQHRKFNE